MPLGRRHPMISPLEAGAALLGLVSFAAATAHLLAEGLLLALRRAAGG